MALDLWASALAPYHAKLARHTKLASDIVTLQVSTSFHDETCLSCPEAAPGDRPDLPPRLLLQVLLLMIATSGPIAVFPIREPSFTDAVSSWQWAEQADEQGVCIAFAAQISTQAVIV